MNNQILRNTPATLQLSVYSGGDLTDLDATPTLVITDGNGDAVSSGAVTKPGSTTGIYRSILPGQSDLAVLKAAWSGVLAGASLTLYQDYEVVGNLLFTEAEARAAKIVGGQNALEDETKYPDELIGQWRSVITDLMEDRMRRGVIRRYARLRLGGWGGRVLDLSYGHTVLASGATINRRGRIWDIDRVISATVGGTAQTVSDLEVVGHKLYHTTSSWTQATYTDPANIVVEYEYGPDPVWPEAHQRALDLLLANAAPKGFPSSATSVSTEDGTFRITNFPVAVEEFFSSHKYRVGFGVA